MREDTNIDEMIGGRTEEELQKIAEEEKQQKVKRGRGRSKKVLLRDGVLTDDVSKRKEPEVWKELINISTEVRVYISNKGNIKTALKARKDLTGRPLVELAGVWVPVEELVASAFLPGCASSSVQSDEVYKERTLVHKDGNFMNNDAANLIYMKTETLGYIRTERHRPYVIPEDVMQGRYPELHSRSPYYQYSMDLEKKYDKMPDKFTPAQCMMIETLVADKCSEIMTAYLMDQVPGTMHTALPFLKCSASEVPPSEMNNGLPGSLAYSDYQRIQNNDAGDIASMFNIKTRVPRSSVSGNASMIEKAIEDQEYSRLKTNQMSQDYLDPKMEYEILSGESIPGWRDNCIDTYVVKGRRVIDSGYVLVRRDYPGKTSVTYRIKKDIWDQAAKLLRSIQNGRPLKDAINISIIPIRENKKIMKYRYLRDEKGVYIKPKTLKSESEMTKASDWFTNPYQTDDPTLGGRLKEFDANEIEMVLVLCETLYREFLEVIRTIEKGERDLERIERDSQKKREQKYAARQESNEKRLERDIDALRENAAKRNDGRYDIGLLTEKERQILIDNIREIGTQTVMQMGIARGIGSGPEWGSGGHSVRVKAEFFDGHFKIYSSMKEASEDLGVDPAQISKCVHGKIRNSIAKGIRFVPIDVREDIAVLLSIINRFNKENQPYADRERRRIKADTERWKQKHPDNPILKRGGSLDSPGRPVGSKTHIPEKVELVPELVKKPEIGEDERTVGEIYDEYMETEALKDRLVNKNRSVGTDGSEIPDDEDLDALLRDDI